MVSRRWVDFVLDRSISGFVSQIANSQIKHVDENTGQIKENVWEFQHPNFQAGGKADLDSIKVGCGAFILQIPLIGRLILHVEWSDPDKTRASAASAQC